MDSKMYNNKESDIVYLGIGKDDFVPVAKDHWLTDMIGDGDLLKNISCGIIEFNFSNNENESMDRR